MYTSLRKGRGFPAYLLRTLLWRRQPLPRGRDYDLADDLVLCSDDMQSDTHSYIYVVWPSLVMPIGIYMVDDMHSVTYVCICGLAYDGCFALLPSGL